MTTIAVSHTGPSNSEVARRLSLTVRSTQAQSPAENLAPGPSTVLSLSTPSAQDPVYTRPKAAEEWVVTQRRAWAMPPQDDISTLMARNSNRGTAGGLASQWRGLGGALLSHVASTGKNYQQTLANYVATEDVAGLSADRAQSLDAAALRRVPKDAALVSLTLRTRSGQTIELSITVNNQAAQGQGGLQIAVTASGPLSSSEQKALAQLAGSFDEVLEGLGHPHAPRMDVGNLLAYDSTVFDSLDLSVRNAQASQPLASFQLHLGPDRKTLDFKGAVGEVSLNLDTQMPFGTGSAHQRQAAIAEHLRRFDAAAARSHADNQLLTLFKDAFTQLHSAPASTAWSPSAARPQSLATQVQALQKGLADFEASFHGDFERTGAYGGVVEQGNAHYEISQKTELEQQAGPDHLAVTQTLSEKLTAQYMKSRTGVMLDLEGGNYDIFKIRDSTVTATTLSIADGELAHAERRTEQSLLETMKRLVNHRVEAESGTPMNRSLVTQLF